MGTVLKPIFAALAISFMLQAPASAHEQAVAFTELTIKPIGTDTDCSVEGCRVEVAHRLAIHDAESTLMNVLGTRADLYGDRDAQAKFEAYVAEQFAMADAETGQSIDLSLLGGEVERGYYWVYQEGVVPASVEEIDLRQTVLMDAIPAQTNRVNIRQNGTTRTLVFRGGTRAQAYRIR